MSVFNDSLTTTSSTTTTTTSATTSAERDASQCMLEDLQLAAELGKTLLERNKELEINLKHQQLIIDDQSQEIEYLTKQTVALRSVNESRLKLYENLEVSILELERGNHRLLCENVTLKKLNKSLKTNTETLDTRCDELNKQLDELNIKYDAERRKSERIFHERMDTSIGTRKVDKKSELKNTEKEIAQINPDALELSITSVTNQSFPEQQHQQLSTTSIADLTLFSVESVNDDDNVHLQTEARSEEYLRLITELEATKRLYINEQQRAAELEDQMNVLIQDNRTLQNRTVELASTGDVRSMQDELAVLEEVRYGKMCSRCLGNVDEVFTIPDEDASVAGTDDGDDQTLMEATETNDAQEYLMNDDSTEVNQTTTAKSTPKQENILDKNGLLSNGDNSNPYRELVEKYEALMEVQRHPIIKNHQINEDPISGDFNNSSKPNGDDCRRNKPRRENGGTIRKVCTRTPTDFSEAETSSSGFFDETSHKYTQTEETFLCTIADGDDKFSIYDGASPIDSRFRNRPEYRELFKEIFGILKKAAENKDEGEKLPLLDDANSGFSVPPVTPAEEDLPSFTDETESVISSVMSEQSVAMSERITKHERKNIMDTVKKHIEKNEQENKPPFEKKVFEDGKVLVPLKREPLEYLSVSVNVRKKKKKSKNVSLDRSDSPILPTPPRFYYTSSGRKRRDLRPFANTDYSPQAQTSGGWNGNSVTIYNRSLNSMPSTPTPTTSTIMHVKPREIERIIPKDMKRGSTASQDLHKLIKLDLSYAEVLRRADHTKYQMHRKK